LYCIVFLFFSLAVTACIVGLAYSNQQLLASVEECYVYKRSSDERQAIRTLIETKTLLSQRQLRIYVVN
jgi:hypothetical protein